MVAIHIISREAPPWKTWLRDYLWRKGKLRRNYKPGTCRDSNPWPLDHQTCARPLCHNVSYVTKCPYNEAARVIVGNLRSILQNGFLNYRHHGTRLRMWESQAIIIKGWNQPVEKSSALRSRNKTGVWCSIPSGGSQSAGAPGTPDPGAGTMTKCLSSVR